ncbi:MAG: tRNA (adenosine(37)-N6)-threonylcarbamoyltransferase complex dimerization subunit type 1 TsaB [bacterium]|nr:tRNA (adenosine(37)-N6)-threonylcarbamoyltransferase complex dimerization subunit type 1 TsaB [bacterium]
MSVILGIDTTSKMCEVSLKIGREYKVIMINEGLVHSEKTLPLIEQILTENNLTLRDLNKIVVNIGPGSFTGIRVGVSVARAIAQVLNIKVYGVVGLDVLMYKFLRINKVNKNKIVVLQDALRGEFYSATYSSKGRRITDYSILKKENIDPINKVFIEASGSSGKYLIKFIDFENLKPTHYQDIKPFYIRKTAAEESKACHS